MLGTTVCTRKNSLLSLRQYSEFLRVPAYIFTDLLLFLLSNRLSVVSVGVVKSEREAAHSIALCLLQIAVSPERRLMRWWCPFSPSAADPFVTVTTSMERLLSLLLTQTHSYIITQTCSISVFLRLSGRAAPRLMGPHHDPAPGSKAGTDCIWRLLQACVGQGFCVHVSSVQGHVCTWCFPLQSNFEWTFILRDSWKWRHTCQFVAHFACAPGFCPCWLCTKGTRRSSLWG